MLRCFFTLLALFAAAGFSGQASAYPNFFKAWVKTYVAESENAELKDLVLKQAKCLVCHQGKKKDQLNPYGHNFYGHEGESDHLIGKKDQKNEAKILKAIQAVGELHSVEGDEESPTYAELIASGKLPGGELEDLKKEPGE